MKTNREFRDIETGMAYDLCQHPQTHAFSLVSKDGINTVNGFYLCTISGVTVKLNTGKIIALELGMFYNLKEGERVIKRKFDGENRFKKI
jgi:uncharacterized protein YrrD